MGRLKWQQIRAVLREQEVPPGPCPAGEFWESFRARAALAHPINDFESIGNPWWQSRPFHVALAAAIVVLAAVLWILPMQFTSVPATTVAAVSEVEEVDVFVNYTSMMIMQDEKNGGTIVWVADLGRNAR